MGVIRWVGGACFVFSWSTIDNYKQISVGNKNKVDSAIGKRNNLETQPAPACRHFVGLTFPGLPMNTAAATELIKGQVQPNSDQYKLYIHKFFTFIICLSCP